MRVPCGLRVEVAAGPEPITAEVMNISQKGLFLRPLVPSHADTLRLSTSLSPSDPLVIAFNFVGDERETRVRCYVAWKSDMGVGINFDEPPERLRDFISDLVDAEHKDPVLSQVANGRVEVAVG